MIRWFKAVTRKIIHLFVDDGATALGILIWLCLFWMICRHGGVAMTGKGAILFAGLAAILIENTARRARR